MMFNQKKALTVPSSTGSLIFLIIVLAVLIFIPSKLYAAVKLIAPSDWFEDDEDKDNNKDVVDQTGLKFDLDKLETRLCFDGSNYEKTLFLNNYLVGYHENKDKFENIEYQIDLEHSNLEDFDKARYKEAITIINDNYLKFSFFSDAKNKVWLPVGKKRFTFYVDAELDSEQTNLAFKIELRGDSCP